PVLDGLLAEARHEQERQPGGVPRAAVEVVEPHHPVRGEVRPVTLPLITLPLDHGGAFCTRRPKGADPGSRVGPLLRPRGGPPTGCLTPSSWAPATTAWSPPTCSPTRAGTCWSWRRRTNPAGRCAAPS